MTERWVWDSEAATVARLDEDEDWPGGEGDVAASEHAAWVGLVRDLEGSMVRESRMREDLKFRFDEANSGLADVVACLIKAKAGLASCSGVVRSIVIVPAPGDRCGGTRYLSGVVGEGERCPGCRACS